jgi:AcrR family transcriptional regulator
MIGMSGRPRSPEVDGAIRRATLELAEELGYSGVTIESIAARSGVAKQTIYRRYQSKGEVILDAFAACGGEQAPTPDTGSLREDLRLLLEATFTAQQGISGVLNRALAGEGLQHDGFAELLWERLIDRCRTVVREVIRRGRDRGEIRHPDDDFLADLVFGPLWYGLLFDRSVLDAAYATQVTDAVLAVGQLDAPGSRPPRRQPSGGAERGGDEG